MNIGDAAFDPATFSKNRERLLDHEVAHRFFNAVRAEAERRQLLSDDHFTVDGTLLEAWASQHTTGRRSAIDERTTRHAGYAISQRVRKRVEEIFGWKKTVGGGRKLRYIGQRRNEMWMLLTVSAYNLVRMANLELAPG